MDLDLTIPRKIPPLVPKEDFILPPLPPVSENDDNIFITLSLKELHYLIKSKCIKKHEKKTVKKVRRKKSIKRIIIEFLREKNEWCNYKEIKGSLEDHFRNNSLQITNNLKNQIGSNLSKLYTENLIFKHGRRKFYKYKINPIVLSINK